MCMKFDELILRVNEDGFHVEGTKINQMDLVFEERVKMNCFYCARYNVSWKCPPKIPDLNYRKMVFEYENAALIYVRMPLKDNDFETVRKDSTVHLHRAMLDCEKWLYRCDNSMAISFIGGSCKLCKNGCAPNRCANPYQARSSVEAIGINVVKSAAQYGIKVTFPPMDFIYRIGLLLW